MSAFAPPPLPPAGRQRAAAAAQREASAEPPLAERPLPEDAAVDGETLPDVEQDQFVPGRLPNSIVYCTTWGAATVSEFGIKLLSRTPYVTSALELDISPTRTADSVLLPCT